MIGRVRLGYSDALTAIDALLYRYGFMVEEWPGFVSHDLFRFSLEVYSLEGVNVKNSLLVVDGYMGKLEVAYLS
jgi:hypothetical protein